MTWSASAGQSDIDYPGFNSCMGELAQLVERNVSNVEARGLKLRFSTLFLLQSVGTVSVD